MSKYGWEGGSLKLPSAAWAPFKKAIQEGMTKHMAEDFALALKLHAALLALKKATRGLNLRKAFEEEFYRLEGSSSRWSDGTRKKYPFKSKEEYEVLASLLGTGTGATLHSVLRLPMKKDFPKFTNVSLSFTADSCSLHLINASRTMEWRVSDNNHSVENAHDTALYSVMSNALAKVMWTRNTGGTFCGNDEYNKEDEDEGGGANYVTARYGPLGEYREPFSRTTTRKRAVKKVAATPSPTRK
ncbi:MAG: hypothetical protein Q7S87_03290 [Agitococcus sp.]|nr:hypothetical protein [Agitococcus sp.]MDO9178660.1 hypothetical protein [Agitococcus sp.]